MPAYKKEELLGYAVGEEGYHENCFEGEDFDSVITEGDIEGSLFVCNKCGKKIE